MEETITITKKEYDKLVDDSNFLSALKGAGVNVAPMETESS